MRVHHITLAVASSLFTAAVAAGDSAIFRGQSTKYLVEFQDPMDMANTTIEVSEYVESNFGYTKKVLSASFRSECLASANEIRCTKNGKSPLAGATYKRTLDGTPTCPGQVEYRFTCVVGCTAIAPRYIRIDRYEC
jgi:hypothetical protein